MGNLKPIKIISGLFIAFGFYAIVFWIFHYHGIKILFNQKIYLVFNTALCFILLGCATLFTDIFDLKWKKIWFYFFILVTVLISGLSLSQSLFHYLAGIDQFFISDTFGIANKNKHPGRMNPTVATIFLVFALAFLGFRTNKKIVIIISQYALHLITALVSTAIISFVYNPSFLNNVTVEGPIILTVAFLFFFMSVSATLLHPNIGITRLFSGTLVGNQMARRLFTLMVFTILVFGFIRVHSLNFKFFAFDTSFSLLTVCLIILSLIIIWNTANWLNKIDNERSIATNRIKELNEDLERIVVERTSELMEILARFKDSESKFRTLVEKSLVGVYISQNERFTYVNPRLADIFGYEQHELINTKDSPIEFIFNKEDRDMVRHKVQARYRGDLEIDHYEVNGIKKDGTNNRVEFYGSRIIIENTPTIIGTMLDITERTKAAEVLKRSEANLKTIFDTTDIAYILFDKKLKVISFNQMALKLVREQFNLGVEENQPMAYFFEKNDFSGIQLENLNDFYKERFKKFVENAKRVLAGENISYELNYILPDGSASWFFVRLFPITDDKNEKFGLMVELSDITERKNAEEKLKSAYQRIQDHIASIREMSWKQSHLIRGPLANLKGLAKIVQDNPNDKEALSYIESELERLDNVLIEMATDTAKNENV